MVTKTNVHLSTVTVGKTRNYLYLGVNSFEDTLFPGCGNIYLGTTLPISIACLWLYALPPINNHLIILHNSCWIYVSLERFIVKLRRKSWMYLDLLIPKYPVSLIYYKREQKCVTLWEMAFYKGVLCTFVRLTVRCCYYFAYISVILFTNKTGKLRVRIT
jgi:hypothetical protein